MAISPISSGALPIQPTNTQSVDGNSRPAGAVGDSQEQSRISTGNNGGSESAQAVNQSQQESANASSTQPASTTQVVTSADEVLGTGLGQIVDTRA
ncbi:hypothetical protein [Motiliproteus sediminis]|uniref:hypothetical protein n=1 Tax=Motiliproteus sediminis TaxID=1468178 RepID=UPI001AEF9DC7|nr:hypothetical protein [Motiliproteus sediminis]